MKEFTKEERQAFAKLATETRQKRVVVKEKLNNRELSTEEVLTNLDKYPCMNRMRVSEFIRAHQGFGMAKADKIMKELSIPASRRLQGMNERKVNELIEAITRYSK